MRFLVLLVLLLAAACAPTVLVPGPPVARPALADGGLTMADGTRLPVHSWLPDDDPPRAVVIALHGFNDYGNFFADAGAYLSGRGVAAYAYDQRGFGDSPNRGLWPGVPALVDDLVNAVAAVRARHSGIPLYLIGASMGGAVAMLAMGSPEPPEVDGVILAAPAVWGRATMPFYQRWALWLGAHTVPWLKVSGRGLKITASDNRDMLLALGRDPLIIKETRLDALYGMVNLMDAALEAGAGFPGPALILYGAHDEIIPKEPMGRIIAALGGAKRLALYEGGYHMLLRDVRADVVWADIAAWIADTAAPLPSGADGVDPAKLLGGE
jgi:alpha-beta hydrolase superfamily lysophospholipase